MRSTRNFAAALIGIPLCLILLLSAPAQAQSGPVGFGASPNEFRAGQTGTVRLYTSSSTSSLLTLSTGDTFNFFFEPSIGSVTAIAGLVSVDSSTLSAADFSASLVPAQNQVVVTYNGQPKTFAYGNIVSLEISLTASGQTGSGKISFSSRFTSAVNGNLPYTTVSIVDFGGTVTHDSTLTGDGSPGSPLGIAPGGVNTTQLANGAVTGPKIANGAVGTPQLADGSVIQSKIARGAVGLVQLADSSVIESKIAAGAVGPVELANGAVTSSKIANGTVVRSLNGMSDSVTLAAGSNVTITPSGNTLTIAGSGNTAVAYFARIDGFTPRLNTRTVILSKDVPAGSYLIFVSVPALNEDSGGEQNLNCNLSANGVDVRIQQQLRLATSADPGDEGVLNILDAETFNVPTTLTVSCIGFKIQGIGPLLIAHRIDSIQ
jgi:hypothetical protein